MAKKSFLSALGRAPVALEWLVSTATAVNVEEKAGEWDASTRTYTQKVSATGVPQWTVYALFTPREDDTDHAPEVVPVTITSPTSPVIQPGRPIDFVNLRMWTYVQKSRDGRATGVARSFSADGVCQSQDDEDEF